MNEYITAKPKRNLEIIKDIFEVLQKFDAFIAGGFARHSLLDYNTSYSDIDIYSRSNKKYEDLRDFLIGMLTVKNESETSITFENNWSIIKPILDFYGEPDKVLDSFDFTICQAAIVSPEECIHAKTFFEDEDKKRLIIFNTTYAINTFFRVIKYAKKGYYIPPLEVLKIFNSYHCMGEEMSELISSSLFQGKIFTQEMIDHQKNLIKKALVNKLKGKS